MNIFESNDIPIKRCWWNYCKSWKTGSLHNGLWRKLRETLRKKVVCSWQEKLFVKNQKQFRDNITKLFCDFSRKRFLQKTRNDCWFWTKNHFSQKTRNHFSHLAKNHLWQKTQKHFSQKMNNCFSQKTRNRFSQNAKNCFSQKTRNNFLQKTRNGFSRRTRS